MSPAEIEKKELWKNTAKLASVGGSFAATWARVVLKKCSSERWGREKRFYVGRRGERRRAAFWRAAQNTLGASGAKPTRACVPRTVNGTGHRVRFGRESGWGPPPGSSDETRPASARSRVEVVNAMMLSRNTSGATNLAQKLAHVQCSFGVPRVSKVLALTCFLGNYPWRRRSESKEGNRCFGSDAKGTPRQL